MGKEKTEDMLFLIKDEYNAFDYERDNIRITKIFMEVSVEEAEIPDIQQDDAL